MPERRTMEDELNTLIEKYVAKGIPRKMAKMLAQAKLKKKEGGSDSKETIQEDDAKQVTTIMPTAGRRTSETAPRVEPVAVRSPMYDAQR